MLKVAVAGGSIGGLCAGIALRGIGCDVEIHERASGPMTSRGAGIVAQQQLLRLFERHGLPDLPTTSCHYRQYLLPDGGESVRAEMPLRLTSWNAIYRTLRSAFSEEQYHPGSTLVGFVQEVGGVVAHFERADIKTDLLICAEGSRSETRRRLLPEVQPSYSGYVAWRGTLDEETAPPTLVRFFDQSFTLCEGRSGGHILCYFIPGADARTEAGRRQLNWVWYVNVPNGSKLERLLTDKHGTLHVASVPMGMVPTELVAEVHATAAQELHPCFVELVQRTSDPFIQVIVDVAVPQMAFGRLCLLGDAAFVLRPHPAAATAKAAADATALATVIAADPDDPSRALRTWETKQLAYGRSLSDQAVAVGRRSVDRHAGSRTMADVMERFRGVSPALPVA